MELRDKLTLDDVKITGEGFLVARAKIARTGIQDYFGFEVGRYGDDTDRVFKVYRPAEEVFASDALKSFERKPVTDGHPFSPVNAKNAKEVTLGVTGDQVIQSDIFVETTVTLFDAGVVNDVQRGRRELSAGYSLDLDWTPGVTDAGEAYDAVQRQIRGNHVAIVDAGRCGSECRIGDCACSGGASCNCKGDEDVTKHTVNLDGFTVELDDNGKRAVDKLQHDLKAANDLLDEGAKDLQARDAEITDLKSQIEKKDGEIAALKANELSDAEIDARVSERTGVVDKAAKLVKNFTADGKSVMDIRKEAVVAKMGEDAVKDRSDDYVTAMFDTLKTGDPLRQNLGAVSDSDTQDAHTVYEQGLTDAWKPKAIN